MERRLAIKQILIMAGGLAILPSCLKDAGKSSIQLKNIQASLDQEQLLAEVAETIIPRTGTPGAKELKLHLFVLKMLDDCHEENEQQLFLKGLDRLQALAKDQYSGSYEKLAYPERQKLLLQLEAMQAGQAGAQKEQELATFYQIMKRRTIGGFLNSKYIMSNVMKWELVPGRYNGYFPVKSA